MVQFANSCKSDIYEYFEIFIEFFLKKVVKKFGDSKIVRIFAM